MPRLCGTKIRKLMDRDGHTLSSLSDETDIHRITLGIVISEKREARRKTAIQIAKALRVKLSDIIKSEE